jgi:hypothetical protein
MEYLNTFSDIFKRFLPFFCRLKESFVLPHILFILIQPKVTLPRNHLSNLIEYEFYITSLNIFLTIHHSLKY